MTDRELIDGILRGDEKAFDYLYKDIRPKFLAWGRGRYNVSDETIIDAFQNTMLAVWLNIRNGKYQEGKATLQTYIFAIGKRKLLDLADEHKDEVTFSDSERINLDKSISDMADDLDNSEEQSERMERVYRKLQQLGHPCRRVLELFYFEGLSMEEIAIRMNYRTANVAKKTKSNCLKKLGGQFGGGDQSMGENP